MLLLFIVTITGSVLVPRDLDWDSPIVTCTVQTPHKIESAQPRPPRELISKKTKQSSGRRSPECREMGRESSKGHNSMSEGKAERGKQPDQCIGDTFPWTWLGRVWLFPNKTWTKPPNRFHTYAFTSWYRCLWASLICSVSYLNNMTDYIFKLAPGKT